MSTDTKSQTLEELEKLAPSVSTKKALVGIDGFVDKIVHPVDQRTGPGDQFTAIPTIAEFGARISSAAGKSANIELAPVVEKLGGNGPIMANAQCAQGVQVRYLGALGKASIDPIFTEFAEKTQAVSIADPGITHAAEFTDGKIMLGTT
ncbi:MAG: carbohydrate kinase family protein, partial [Coraliomargarita sp.]